MSIKKNLQKLQSIFFIYLLYTKNNSSALQCEKKYAKMHKLNAKNTRGQRKKQIEILRTYC